MIARTVAVAIVVTCLVHGGLSLGGSGGAAVSTRSAAVFFNAAASSSLTSNIGALNSSLATMQMSIDNIITNGQTQEVRDAVMYVSKTVGRFLKLSFRFTKALSNLASDKTIPIEELFEQFEKAAERLITFMKKDEEEFKQELKDNLGVPIARDFAVKWKKIKQELMNVVANVERLKKAVLSSHRKEDDTKGESRASITQLVTIFASSIAKLKSATAELTTAVGSITMGLQTANSFLNQVIGTRNSTRATVKSTRADLRKALLTERKSGLDKYYVAQSKIRKDLSGSISKLVIFSTSKKLNRLSKKFDDSYYELYHFLRQQNRTDASHIGKSYHSILDNLLEIFDKSVEIFFYAMRRTYMRLADVVFESSFYNDFCYTTYTYSVPAKYQAINTLITDCTTREKTRWMAIATAIQDEVNLLQSSSEELATNIARCATYTNFITDSADYNQAEACLKTNLEDIRELSAVLKPQFMNLVNLVKAQVEPSKYRLENCFVSRLHELTALLKSIRESMNECGGRFDSKSRDGTEDAESDYYNRHRGEVCEKVDTEQNAQSTEDVDMKPQPDNKKCKKPDKDVAESSDKESGEQGSAEQDSGEKKSKKHKKDKNDKKDKIGGGSDEEDSGEKKHKYKKDKKDKTKPKTGSEEVDSGEKGGGEKSSEEKDSEEKKDEKDKKDKKNKKKPSWNKHSSEENCSKEKDISKEKWSKENSEEEFDRKKLKGYSNNEEDIFNRKFGVQQPQKDTAVVLEDLAAPADPVAPAPAAVAPVADGILKRLLESSPAAEDEQQIDISVKVVGETERPDQASATTGDEVEVV